MAVISSNLDLENPGFKDAWEVLSQSPHSVFLTGKAGTGKSTFLKHICQETKKNFVVVAPTGIAAVNVRGVTIHSFFQIPLGPILPADKRLTKLKLNREKLKVMRELDLLIIDEISMVRADVMDAIDRVLRIVKRKPLPFGGAQLLLVGDLFQLEPVTVGEEWELLENYYDSPFFFSAWAFKEINLVNIELTKIYRQSDPFFIDLLNNIRNATPSSADFEELNSLPSRQPILSDKFYITLTATRAAADNTNQRELRKLPGPNYVSHGKIEGNFPQNNLPADLELKLKINAQVIFVRNDTGEPRRWVNGTIGKVEKIEEGKVLIRLDNDELVDVEKVEWENIQYKYDPREKQIKDSAVGTFTQYPLKLAWAITIHKSQGLTFENVEIDIGRGAFAAGQLYVALSRCTSLEGIVLKSRIHPGDVIVREEVLDFYKTMNDEQQIADAKRSKK